MSASGPVSVEERLARAALSRISEPGLPRMMDLVARFGAEAVLDRLRAEPDPGGLGADLSGRLAVADAAGDLERASRLGIRFVVPGDEEWPPTLDDLARGPELHRRGGVPVGVWVRGPVPLSQAVQRAVAVVGSRSATGYGEDNAGSIAHGLAHNGWTVVSGAAHGIDQAAHRGALGAPGTTVGVLACGVDRVYPKENRLLIDRIGETGVLVSEAPLGSAPTRIRFLARNRLIAAMTRGTVVVEAAVRSGALNTANWAGRLGRVVMGVPGPVTSAPSQGVHELIRNRDAVLVTRTAEVLEAIAPIGQETLPELREPPAARDRLSSVQRQVLDAVPVARAAPADHIARVAGLRAGTVEAELARLEKVDLVCRTGDRWLLSPEDSPGTPD